MAQLILDVLLYALFPAAMAYAAASDLLTMTIPNRLIVALVAAFLVLAPFSGMSWQEFGLHWATAGAVLAAGFICFAFGWIGGGDAKLAAAVALWMGFGNGVEFVGLASIFGGGLTLLLLGFRRAVVPAFIIRQPWVQRLHDRETGVPYGIALAAAGLAVYPHTVWMQGALG